MRGRLDGNRNRLRRGNDGASLPKDHYLLRGITAATNEPDDAPDEEDSPQGGDYVLHREVGT